MNVLQIKQRFGIIGLSPLLDRAINTAIQVAPTDLSVLITGESGTGKEIMPQIIHQLSSRKHNQYIAVNCGAIPEGTIDSELFGHEKGSFTGAHNDRKGYFEVADGGTIFLDEVAELPVQTQVRLLRVLETGEFIKVGSSKVLKTNVRIVAATNVNIPEAIRKGKFREDLYYRLNTVPIQLPALRERKEDIHLLFRKFAADFAEKYRMPAVRLNEDAQKVLTNYTWPGNIRQVKNITEQISIIEQQREIDAPTLLRYLPNFTDNKLPAIYNEEAKNEFSEREILYKVLFDMRNDLTDLKKLVFDLIQNGGGTLPKENIENTSLIKRLYADFPQKASPVTDQFFKPTSTAIDSPVDHFMEDYQEPEEFVEESLSLQDKEIEMIKRALEKHRGRRKDAALELGISERTLYRKINEHNLK